MDCMATYELDARGLIVGCPSCGQKNRLTYQRLADPMRCARCKTSIPPPASPIDIQSTADFDRLVGSASLPIIVDMPNGTFLAVAVLLPAGIAIAQSRGQQPFNLEEATIADLQQKMQAGSETSRSLAEKYLARIDAVDRSGPALHSVLETNPDALAIADQLDAERKARGPRGPLHGIPILLKDNIATADRMMTTAGSLALAGVVPPRDAFIVNRLREAGVVILG